MNHATARLTERQRACLRLVGDGYTSKEIGRQLGISPATVDNHVRASLEILQVESRAEAARLLRTGGTGQPLTSQAGAVAAMPPIDAALRPAVEPARSLAMSSGAWVPPLGGRPHDLSWDEKLFAVLRVAVIGLAGLVTLTLGAAALLWLTR